MSSREVVSAFRSGRPSVSWPRPWIALVIVFGLMAIVVAAPSSPTAWATALAGRAASAPTSNGGSRIIGVPSGRCLDVIGGSTAPGTRVQLWDCLGDPQQAWVYSAGRLEVYSGAEVMCLDANDNYGGANGTPVQVWTCTGKSNQAWTAAPDGTLRSVAYGLCLDAINGGKTNGTLLQLWRCIGDAQQDWVGAPTPNGGGPVKGLGSGRCLDVPGASISPGARPWLWDCLGDAQQQWRLNGRELQVYDDKCLDATNDGTTPGTPVQIWYCNGYPQQQWAWDADGTIRSLPSGLCLQPVNQGTSNGTQLQLSNCTGSGGQVWTRATPPVAPAPTPAVSPTPVPTPIPLPKAPHHLNVRLVLSWNWRGGTTWLAKATIGRFPARMRLTIRCSGRGCGHSRKVTARGRRSVHRVLRALVGGRYRAGDVLHIKFTAPGLTPERAEVIIRDGRKPRVGVAK